MPPTLLFSSFHNYLDQGSGAAISAREVGRRLSKVNNGGVCDVVYFLKFKIFFKKKLDVGFSGCYSGNRRFDR